MAFLFTIKTCFGGDDMRYGRGKDKIHCGKKTATHILFDVESPHQRLLSYFKTLSYIQPQTP